MKSFEPLSSAPRKTIKATLVGIALSSIVYMASASIASAQETITLWSDGAPGYKDRADIEEIAKDYYVKQVNNPSLTIYRPITGTANGSAVIILPGGGHRLLVINSEGRDAAQFMARQGITAFVLRYRLFREKDSPYSLDDARIDTERAIRPVRSKAEELGLNPDRIGIMAFSAGGELARPALLSPPVTPPSSGLASNEQKNIPKAKTDPIDTISSRPNFGVLVYPGPLKAEIENVTVNSPPLFMVAANDDACCSAPILELATAYNKAKASAEVHLYAKGGHAFNMGQRTDITNLAQWPERLKEWLIQQGLRNKQP